jgi:hypothetical protein
MLLQVVQDVREPGFCVVLGRKVMGLFLVQLFRKNMFEDLGAERFQQGTQCCPSKKTDDHLLYMEGKSASMVQPPSGWLDALILAW